MLILDSGSSDRTLDIARAKGATVYHQDWLGFPKQKNKAFELAKNDWVLFLEADEIVTPRLAEEIQEKLASEIDDRDAFYPDRRPECLGVMMENDNRASMQPKYPRLFNRKFTRYDESTPRHATVVVQGRSLPLKGILLHWRVMSVYEYMASINKSASQEAEMLVERGKKVSLFKVILIPLLRFGWFYFAKKGYKRGMQGYIHAKIKESNDFLRFAMAWEAQNAPHPVDPPESVLSLASCRPTSKPLETTHLEA